MMDTNQPLRIATEKLSKDVIKKLESGDWKLYGGVLRNVTDKTQIVKHVPMIPFDADDAINGSKSLMEVAGQVQQAQNVAVGIAAVSTVAIMGAIVVSTIYLSRKIDKLHQAIDMIQKEIEDQNLIYYMEKITNYFGSCEYLRELIVRPELLAENQDIIVLQLSDLGVQRNQLFTFIDSLVHVSDAFGEGSKSLAIDFINLSMDLIPKGVFVETQAAYLLERFELGEMIRHSSFRKYVDLRDRYKEWGNEKIRKVHSGRIGPGEKVMMARLDEIRAVVTSDENRMLLEISV